VSVRNSGAYGRYIVIDHGNGYRTLYAHLNAFHVRMGDRVGAGQSIGGVGKSGNATGYHLHYEVHRNGQTVDPIAYVPR
jgi:murein DD-endopeptidase MepM/ murein hydrolase activator NlpD